uniref:Reverse transcriptase Ty1/copia-type domain-containing protein n=1 Tax=Tanacetum cinerariifolium TaxID=118510 RepID=A0A6L2JXE4_TANCI|nr:hypothetical protein [Tanacetum cinerariifolium]
MDEMGIVIRNKARLVAQGYTQEEGTEYDEVFSPVARIKEIRLFLAYVSFKDFVVYMDVKSAFLYGKIEKKVFTEVKTTSTPIETQKPLLIDEDGKEVDVYMHRYQFNPKVSHLYAVKRIFRYLKGQSKLGLLYPKDSPFDLVAYTDSDSVGASLDRKSTTGDCQYLGCRLISWQCKKQTMVVNSITKFEYMDASSCCGQVLWIQNQLLDYGKSDTQVPQPSDPTNNVADEVIHKELGDSLVRVAITASSLEAKQDNSNINKTQSKATPNESSSQGTNSDGSPRVESSGDDESLEMFVVNALDGEEVFVARQNENVVEEVVDVAQVSTAATTITIITEEITLAQALKALKTLKPKAKGVVIQETSESTTTTIPKQQSQDKGKGRMVEEPVKPKKKDQIRLDKEAAKRSQAEFDKEERLARAKAKKTRSQYCLD